MGDPLLNQAEMCDFLRLGNHDAWDIYSSYQLDSKGETVTMELLKLQYLKVELRTYKHIEQLY